jgi:hypothetical protein
LPALEVAWKFRQYRRGLVRHEMVNRCKLQFKTMCAWTNSIGKAAEIMPGVFSKQEGFILIGRFLILR